METEIIRKQKNHAIPALRFQEFKDKWKVFKFNDLVIETRLGGNYSNSINKSYYPLIKMGNLGRGKIILGKIHFIDEAEIIDPKDKINYGDLFFNTRNTLDLVGKVAIWRAELPLAYYNSNLMYIKFSNNFFMNYRFNSFGGIKGLRRLATGTTSVAAIYTKDLLKLKITVPTHEEEQQKIASFLSAVDKKIQQLVRKKEMLETYKKGLMEKLFSQGIRFKDGSGKNFPDWETRRLMQFVTPIKRKVNQPTDVVLSISAGKGFLHQEERFNQIIAGSSLEKYTLLKKNEFSYNRGNSKSYTYGCIYKLKEYEEALVPNIYRSFKLKDGVPKFFEQLFISKYLDRQLRTLISSSARMDGLLNIGQEDFYKCKVPFPSVKEQKLIGEFLQIIDYKIETASQQLTHTQSFKKGLLQQMFV